jgi:hypothetical protein
MPPVNQQTTNWLAVAWDVESELYSRKEKVRACPVQLGNY